MYGQYVAGGGYRKTKQDLLEAAPSNVVWSCKAGHNRLHYKLDDGSEGFILHSTIIATLTHDELTLADGGWHTPTTKSAWGDALAAFGLKSVYHHEAWTGGLDGSYVSPAYDSITAVNVPYPARDERSVTYKLYRYDRPCIGRDGKAFTATCVHVECLTVRDDSPMVRATGESGETGGLEVRFDGKQIISTGGVTHRCTPFKALVTLYRIAELARVTNGFVTMRGNALYDFNFEAMGYTIHPGQTSRIMMVGCHTFKTQDMRAMAKAIAKLYPDAVKPARAFIRKHKTDFGMADYRKAQAERRAAGKQTYHDYIM